MFSTAATTTNIIHHAPEDIVRSSRQRLLVVANRLPVSATKSGPDWSLEVSAGGLVSALLGECFFLSLSLNSVFLPNLLFYLDII